MLPPSNKSLSTVGLEALNVIWETMFTGDWGVWVRVHQGPGFLLDCAVFCFLHISHVLELGHDGDIWGLVSRCVNGQLQSAPGLVFAEA